MKSKASKELTYLALGDSYTIGESVQKEDSWPVQLVKRLAVFGYAFSQPKIIAKTGWTTQELDTAIQQEDIRDTYDLVTLLIGVNNQYRGLDIEEFRKEFNLLLSKAIALANQLPQNVMILSIPDWGISPFAKNRDIHKISATINAFNKVKKEESLKQHVKFVDITEISRKGVNKPKYFAEDGLHYSEEMYRLWVTAILENYFSQNNSKKSGLDHLYKKAMAFDERDLLVSFRDSFYNPKNLIYLDGNSLGKLPLESISAMDIAVKDQWANGLIRSWNENWISLSKQTSKKIAKLLGAHDDEIFVGDTTSLNLYKLGFAALKLQEGRNEILTDELNFPTDMYIFQGLIEHHFSKHRLSVVNSKDGITVDASEIDKGIGKNTAFVSLSAVTYKSAFMYDMKAVNKMAKKEGSLVIWDLSHAAGAVPIDLKETETELAVGCTYKYLNGGPGAPAFLYVSRKMQSKLKNPIWSWFSHIEPFKFEQQYLPTEGIEKFAISTPNILSMTPISVGVNMLLDAGIDKIRAKSTAQTNFLFEMISEVLIPYGFKISSPEDPKIRGSHIAIEHNEAYRINAAMIRPKGTEAVIIPDFRPPNTIRLGVAPLYTSFTELVCCIARIKEIMVHKEYEHISLKKPTVV